jgi:hypothetical protein
LENFLAFGQNYVYLPSGTTCKINHGLTFDTACVGLEGNGSLLDASSIVSGAAITLTTSEPDNPYSANTARYGHFLLNGRGSNTATVGVQINAGGVYLGPVSLAHFGIGIQFGNYAYADRIEGTDIGDAKVGLNCPAGLVDAGEQIVFTDGRIYNGGTGVMDSGCEFNIIGSAIDGMNQTAVENTSGMVRLSNDHIEFFGPIPKAPLEQDNGCNAWVYIKMDGGVIMMDDWSANTMPALIDNSPAQACGGAGPWVKLDNVFISGVQPSGGELVTGSGAAQVQLNCVTNGAGGGSMCDTHYP